MKEHFVQWHPLHIFSEDDKTNYSDRDACFIQSLKRMEQIMDINAYIIDFKNQRILYATKGCSIFLGNTQIDSNSYKGLKCMDRIIHPEDLTHLATINRIVYDFFYALPEERRLKGYFTQDFRVQVNPNKTVLINHRGTVLDLTKDGVLRLTLCVISHPTGNKPGKAYIKMTDTNTAYEYIQSAQKFIEVKTQKLTSKSTSVLELASNGKSEAQIAEILGISINTVKYHKKKIFAQTETKNITEAVQWMNNQKRLTE